MGKKSIYIVCGLGILAGMLQIIGAMLPMHKLGLTMGGVKLYVMIDTHLTSVVLYNPSKKVQDEFVDKLKTETKDADDNDKPDYSFFSADSMSGSYSLEDIRFHLCVASLRLIWPGLCEGFDAAYGTGIALIVILVTNLLCQVVGCYLMYDYSTRKQNPKYREIAASMVLAGGSIFLFVMIGYYFSALQNMNNMSSGIGGALFSPSEASGATSGFIVLIMALIVQLIQGVLILSFTRNEFGEEEYWDRKEAREMGTGVELGPMGGGFGMQQPAGMMVMPAGGMMQGPVVMQPMGQPMMGGAPAW